MGYTYWTPQEDAQLTKLHKNHSCTEIGKIMNRPQPSVVARIRKLGLNTKQQRKFTYGAKLALGWSEW